MEVVFHLPRFTLQNLRIVSSSHSNQLKQNVTKLRSSLISKDPPSFVEPVLVRGLSNSSKHLKQKSSPKGGLAFKYVISRHADACNFTYLAVVQMKIVSNFHDFSFLFFTPLHLSFRVPQVVNTNVHLDLSESTITTIRRITTITRRKLGSSPTHLGGTAKRTHRVARSRISPSRWQSLRLKG